MATSTEVELPDAAETASEANPAVVTLDQKEIDQIRAWEEEADGLTGEADNFRAQAAGLIVRQLDRGATERQVAAAIGKSAPHVHFASVAWRTLQGDESVADFNTAYKMAKRPAPPPAPEQASGDGKADPGGETPDAETPFPPWAKQLRELRRLGAEMVDQANLKQVKILITALEKLIRAAAVKEQDLDSVPGQS